MIRVKIEELINNAIRKLGLPSPNFVIEHPDEMNRGDFAANIALILSKQIGKKPKEIAEEIKKEIEKDLPNEIAKVEVAGPGFINFYLSKDFFRKSLSEIIDSGNVYGKGESLKGKKVLYEYTDPNPFKQFHIGHLMSNAIGEALSRLAEWNGAEVKRMCYGGDVGLHIGKTIWGMIENKKNFPEDGDTLEEKVKFVGEAYTYGNNKYEDDPEAKKEIEEINIKVFSAVGGSALGGEDEDIEVAYKKGKNWSLELFHKMYEFLGTHFDYEIFESEVGNVGKEKVLEAKEKGIFEESEGAVIYKGEKAGLHTRVFINSDRLPTYEAKEIGLAFKKFDLENWDQSVVVTANEQKEYYRVVLAALKEINSRVAEKTTHLTHGMLRLATGKMSSRKGNVITAEELINSIKEEVKEKIKDKEYGENLKEEIMDSVTLGAIKYVILRQHPGKDVIYDSKTALSFEGDSGPYIQYALTRAQSVISKADKDGVYAAVSAPDMAITKLEQMLYRFPEIVERAGEEFSPQLVTTYVTELASTFNGYYADHVIVSTNEIESPYRVALTKAFVTVMRNGLNVLAIPVPEKM